MAEFFDCFFKRVSPANAVVSEHQTVGGYYTTMYGSGKQANRFSIDLDP
jgi:hypothetical protein